MMCLLMNKNILLCVFLLVLTTTLGTINAYQSIDLPTFTTQTFVPETFKGVMKAKLFVSPDCSFNAVVDALNSAQTSLFVEMYSFSNPFILDVIGNLSAKGVNVRVILQEHHASYYEDQYTYWVAYQLYLRGAKVFWASDEFTYTHAKFAIIDNSTILIESENWAKSGIPKNPTYGNRGWGVIIENGDLAEYFLDVFLYDLSIAEPYDPSAVSHGSSVSYYVPSGHYAPAFNLESVNEYMEVEPILSPDFSEDLIIQLINSANTSLYIEQMYIYSSLTDMINAIVNAKKRGVDVKVILEPKASQNNQTVKILVQHGIPVAYANTSHYGSPHQFETMHNKGMIIDGKIVLISSINWSPTSLRDNREVGVIIKNQHIAQYYQQVFLHDWSNAAEIFLGQVVPGGPCAPLGLLVIRIIGVIIVIIVIIIIILYKKKKSS